jgi:hypothetical protein
VLSSRRLAVFRNRSENMRTLVATALSNAKGKDIFCTARKVTDQHIRVIRSIPRQRLEEEGFTFIKMLSLEYPNVKGYAVFFEGHYDEMVKTLKSLEKGLR